MIYLPSYFAGYNSNFGNNLGLVNNMVYNKWLTVLRSVVYLSVSVVELYEVSNVSFDVWW